MRDVSIFRLYFLRTGYLLLVAALGSEIWPVLLDPAKSWELMHGVVLSMLGALSALSLLGLRYPLRMLPLLFFEMAWKTIWLARVALPLWSAHRMDAATADTAFACLMVVIFPIVVPWRYVFENYAKAPGDPWAKRSLSRLPAMRA
jgi:hypothetical protein